MVDAELCETGRQNADQESEERAASHARSARALRTAVVVRGAAGAAGVGRVYRHLGARFHEHGEPLEAAATAEAALADAGLDPSLCEQAWSDAATERTVAAEHRALCDRTRSFGVPTIVLDGGEGPAIFGPVISEVPDDDEAVKMWEHVSWLVRHRSFAELKRDREGVPDLESVRQR